MADRRCLVLAHILYTHVYKFFKILMDITPGQLERLVDERLAVLVELRHLDGVKQ